MTTLGIELLFTAKNIDFIELSRILSFCLEKEQQEDLGIERSVMQRIHPTAKKLKVTGKELLTPWKEDSESLLQFEGGSIGSILTCVLAKTSMICNTRKLKQKLQYLRIRWFVEKKSELRSVKSVIKYNIQVREIGVKLFKVYVNDEFVVSSSIGPDWRYDKVEKRMLWTK